MSGCHSLLEALDDSAIRFPGESFIWSSPTCEDLRADAVGVDVGGVAQMGRLVASRQPTILVLTHDDHDHIGGWKGFAEDGLDTLQQLWMPYEWGALYQLVEQFDCDKEEGIVDDDVEGEWTAARAFDYPGPVEQHRREAGALDIDSALEPVESAIDELAVALHELGTPVDDDRVERDWRGSPQEVAKRAVSRARRILTVISDALQNDVRVRYFSSDHPLVGALPWASAGETGLVTVANAVEVFRPRSHGRGIWAFAKLMALTVQNRRALCPVLWHRGRPAVLVWSDSSGEWARETELGARSLLAHVSVCTAPHHGSRNSAHDPAWIAMRRHFEDRSGVVVLAGGAPTQSSPHFGFNAIEPYKRACTSHRDHGGLHGPRGPVVVAVPCGAYPVLVAGECSS